MENISFNACVQLSLQKHWDRDGLSDYGLQTFQYKDVARIIEKLHIILEASGVKRGDKVAICGRNSSRWGIAFLATLTYGAVAVPILHEFHPDQIHDIVNHSEAKLLFVGDQVWPHLDADKMPALEGIFGNSTDEYKLLVGRTDKVRYARENLNRLFGEKYPMNFRSRDIDYYHDSPDELAVLNYTSGTTSNSKGVMIPFRAMWSNYQFAVEVLGKEMGPGDKILSMLPMAHMYGMAFEFIFEFLHGCHVFYLNRVPSPAIIAKALADIRPVIVIAVPLIIEKIIRKKVFPKIQNNRMRLLMQMPVISKKVRQMICQEVLKAFGGRMYEVIIGGAALNQEVEHFLKKIEFPYTVGYGATECAPIICYNDWHTFAQGSCGRAVKHMEVKIDSPDPARVPGEILTRGLNVMLGYYKDAEATAQTIDRDGWYHTGDLGTIDVRGNVFINGRIKNMLLGPSGQNIYPEEIEDKLNSMTMVVESVVVQRDNKLVALVYPDWDEAHNMNFSQSDLENIMEQNRNGLNQQLPAYEKITEIEIRKEEFEKTPKKSIKRYLYQ